MAQSVVERSSQWRGLFSNTEEEIGVRVSAFAVRSSTSAGARAA